MSDIFDAKDLIARAKSRQKKFGASLTEKEIKAKGNEILVKMADLDKKIKEAQEKGEETDI